MSLDRFVADLDELRSGAPLPEQAVRIDVERRSDWVSSIETVGDPEGSTSQFVHAFPASAVEGSRATLTIPIHSSHDLSHVRPGTGATLVGHASVGRAIAVRIGDDTFLPCGMAIVRALRKPKLKLNRDG